MPTEPRVFVAFQFSEPHETELLLAKLTIEAPVVEGWIVVENTFTHKGDPKGVHLEQILDGDPRFTQFRDRITLVSLDEDLTHGFRYSPMDRVKLAGKVALPGYHSADARLLFAEKPNLHAERRQRDAALEPVFDLSGGEGWVVVSDADEFLDCSRPSRRDQLVHALRSDAYALRFRRQRFNYDIDNLCPAVRFVGCVSIRHLRKAGIGLQAVRLGHDGLVTTLDPLVFEYSFCFPRPSIERKLATFIHAQPEPRRIDDGLACNHVFFHSEPERIVGASWYERVDIEAVGAPEYVLTNASTLRTGNVNPDYAAARRVRYPRLFGERTMTVTK